MSHRYTRLAVVLLAGAAILSGCSGSGSPTQPGGGGEVVPPAPIIWTQLSGGLGVGTVQAMWGASRGDVYAACDEGILHFDGSRWKTEAGSRADSLRAVWGAGGVVFAGGQGGTIIMRSNGVWSDMSGATGLDIHGISGTSATDVYAIASTPDDPGAAELLHFDGSGWSHVDTFDGADGNAVCAVPGMVFMALDGGIMLRYDGTQLLEDQTPVPADLLGVWASSATDAQAVGRGGRIIHWDGTVWMEETSPVATDLYAISGIAANNIMAVGDRGVLLHFDGSAWTTGQVGTSRPLRGACAFSDGHAMAGGPYGSVFSGYLNLLAPDYAGEPFAYECVWSPTAFYRFIVGSSGNVGKIIDRDGTEWFVPEGLHAVSGFAPRDVYAAGDGGAIYHSDGNGWQKQTTSVTFTVRALTSLVTRFNEPFRIYAAGDGGGLAVWKVGNWNIVTPPAAAQGHHFVDVWAAAIDDVFAVADNATSVVRYDDPYELDINNWTVEDTPATAPLLTVGGLRGDVYVASAAGEIFFNNGGGWIPVASPVDTPLRDLRGVAEGSFFAVGDNGVILHGDGNAWRKLDSPFPGTLLGIWGGTNRPLYAVGADGAILVHED